MFKISKIYFLSIFYWLCYYSFPNFSPFTPSTLQPPTLQHPLTFRSCPWVVHISFLSSLFPIPFFFISPCLFYAYQLCFFFPVPFPPIPPFHLPTEIPPCDFHFWFHSCSSCLLSYCFSFLLGSFVDSCEFVVILLFIISIFFSLDKSL